jgi:hypothetical protein
MFAYQFTFYNLIELAIMYFGQWKEKNKRFGRDFASPRTTKPMKSTDFGSFAKKVKDLEYNLS